MYQLEQLKLKWLTTPSAGKDVEELRLSYIAAGSIQWNGHFGKLFDRHLPYDLAILLPGFYLKK